MIDDEVIAEVPVFMGLELNPKDRRMIHAMGESQSNVFEPQFNRLFEVSWVDLSGGV